MVDAISKRSDAEQLACGMFAVFALVAGADATVDAKERRRFEDLLEASAKQSPAHLSAPLQLAFTNRELFLAECQQASFDALGAVAMAVAAGERLLAADQLREYKVALIRIAERVAHASGGGLLGLGQRTSTDETRAIESLRAVLGV